MEKIKNNKKIILAFSGGLDTSFCIPYLKEQGFTVITVTVDTGGFTNADQNEIADKSNLMGATKHYFIDGKESMMQKIISYIIKTNGLYQQSYPNLCTDRYIIAEEIVKIAELEDAANVSHGSSAMGNDQVRFDLALKSLSPELNIITPIRDVGGNREQEMEFLKKKGFSVADNHSKYSINQNILGITYSGSEIDSFHEPDSSILQLTKITKSNPAVIKISFEHGVPVKLNDEKLQAVAILQRLNQLTGSYGFGRNSYTGDCIIGIKGHIFFEAPGILTLITAHTALEQLVLTRNQSTLASIINGQFTSLLYSGLFYDPAIENLKVCIDSLQKSVSGEVYVKCVPNAIHISHLSSPNALVDKKTAQYAQNASWNSEEAEGFIKLYGLQTYIHSLVTKSIVNKTKKQYE